MSGNTSIQQASKSGKVHFHWLVLTLCWLLIALLAYALVILKAHAMGFHSRDYVYYIDFIVKWMKPADQQYYTINPGGYNFLGIYSPDGCRGFYQWIHFEPIRFLQAFIFRLFGSLKAVFFFNALLVTSPVVAIGRWIKTKQGGWWVQLIFILLFALFPSTLLVAGYDNRPSMFLGVIYFWQLYAIFNSKTRFVPFFFFVSLFFIREEALVLNGIICAFWFLKFVQKEIRLSQFLTYFLVWLIYVISLVCYYHYWNYTFFEPTGVRLSWVAITVVALFFVVVLLIAMIRRKPGILLFTPMVLFLVQLYVMWTRNIFPDEGFNIFNDPRNQMWLMIGLGAIIYGSKNLHSTKNVYLLIVPIAFCTLTLFMGKHNLTQQISAYQTAVSKNKIISDHKNDPELTTRIITSYSTHQYFIGRENTYCYQRLPCIMDQSAHRFYPDNKDLLEPLLSKGSWLFLSKNELLELSQNFPDMAYSVVDNNDSFVVSVLN